MPRWRWKCMMGVEKAPEEISWTPMYCSIEIPSRTIAGFPA